jgi:hypothetical protein
MGRQGVTGNGHGRRMFQIITTIESAQVTSRMLIQLRLTLSLSLSELGILIKPFTPPTIG